MKRPLVIVLLSIALLLVMAGISVVVYFSAREGGFGFDSNLASATEEETKTLKVDAKKPVTLNVDNDAGDISVIGADVEAVEVKVIKTGNAPTRSRAEEDLGNIRYEIRQDGNAVTLLYKLDGMQTNHIDTVDFVVTVPADTTVGIETNFGRVDVANVIGSVDIASDFGDVTVKDVAGALTLENSGGEIEIQNLDAKSQDVSVDADFGRITLENVKGRDISIRSNSGTLALIEVRASGELFAKSDFGDTSFENGSASSLTVESSSGKVRIVNTNIRGALAVTCDFSDIELNQTLAGSYDLDSNSGGIVIDGAKKKIEAHTDFGNITVSNAQEATLDLSSNSGTIRFEGSLGAGPHRIKSDFGEIALTLPADSKLNVYLKTDFGNIDSDLPITVVTTGSTGSDKSQITGTVNGGGAQLTVSTNSGNITINALEE